MKFIKVLPNKRPNFNFLLLVLFNFVAFCTFNTNIGIAGGISNTQQPIIPISQPVNLDDKSVLWVVKYQSNGDIAVFDGNNNLIKKLINKFNPSGALTELRNLTTITKKIKSDHMDNRDQHSQLAVGGPKPMPPAALVVQETEQHFLYQDGELVSCRIHRVLPGPHADIGSCM